MSLWSDFSLTLTLTYWTKNFATQPNFFPIRYCLGDDVFYFYNFIVTWDECHTVMCNLVRSYGEARQIHTKVSCDRIHTRFICNCDFRYNWEFLVSSGRFGLLLTYIAANRLAANRFEGRMRPYLKIGSFRQ